MPVQWTEFQSRTGLSRSAEPVSFHLPPLSEPVYRYPVPELGEGGTCSLSHTLADEPYDLMPILAGYRPAVSQVQDPQLAQLLSQLQALTKACSEAMGVDWLGVYLRRINRDGVPVLVKLAYQGVPSRAEFPLTAEFAPLSNNVQVALSGETRLLQDIAAHQAAGRAYYTCDGRVQSEACLPLWCEESESKQSAVIGIVDAESFQPGFFTPEQQQRLVSYCWQAQQLLQRFPPQPE